MRISLAVRMPFIPGGCPVTVVGGIVSTINQPHSIRDTKAECTLGAGALNPFFKREQPGCQQHICRVHLFHGRNARLECLGIGAARHHHRNIHRIPADSTYKITQRLNAHRHVQPLPAIG